MKKKSFSFATSFCLLVLLAVSAVPAHASEGKQVTVPKTFGSSRIRDFQVVDRETVIFEIAGMRDVIAKVSPGCYGLRFSTTLAIRDRAFDLSRGSTLVLADGERCSILSVSLMEDEEPKED